MIKYDVPLGLADDNNLHKLIKNLKPNTKVLEFGPSTGRLTKYMKESLCCDVYGVEIDEEAFEVCKQFLVDGICDDIETYAWTKRFKHIKFDYIIFADVLEHLRNPQEVITIAKEFLNETAEILVSIPNIAHNAILIELIENRFDYNATGLLDNTHIHFFTVDTCKEMFYDAGYHLAYLDGTFAEPYDTEIGNSLEDFPIGVKQYLSSRDYANLYQIIFSFRLTPGDAQDNLTARKKRNFFAKIYLDEGYGLSESAIAIKQLNSIETMQNIEITCEDMSQDTKLVAIKLLDNYIYKCEEIKVLCNGTEIPYEFSGNILEVEKDKYLLYEDKLILNVEVTKNYTISYKVQIIDSYEAFNTYVNGYRHAKHYQCGLEKQISESSDLVERNNALETALRENEKATLKTKKHIIAQSLVTAKRESVLQNRIQQGSFEKGLFNKLYRWMRRMDHALENSLVDVYTINTSSQKYEYHSCDFHIHISLKEDALGDYAVLCFDDAILKQDYFQKMFEFLQNGYADAIFCDSENKAGNACYKSDFSYELLINQCQEYDVLFVNAHIYNALANLFDLDEINSSYEFMLKLTQITDNIAHLKEVLYQYNETDNKFNKTSVLQNLEENLNCKYDGNLDNVEWLDNRHFSVKFNYLKAVPKISIIIPMKDKSELSDACVRSILETSTYANYDILILDNNSELEETFVWFEQIKNNQRVKVIDAKFEFNWSKLNNHGIAHSDAEVFIFLNNDILIITPDWMEKLAEDALRTDSGVAGALLLYDDDTIQHAGVVIGLNDFADHVYKKEPLTYSDTTFISPLDKRNVMAVTGACMAISRNTINKIGNFNDTFIICGSDVEICIRAYKYGLRNIYDPYVRLYHLESKSRDSYIPPIDFEMSIQHYAPYREQGDPYFNPNLSRKDTTPKKRGT